MIVEGRSAFVTDEALLEAVAEAYRNKFGWPLEIRDGDAYYAPSQHRQPGRPPFLPYAVMPEVIYAVGVTDELAPKTTKYTF